jgi:hypothetical protein
VQNDPPYLNLNSGQATILTGEYIAQQSAPLVVSGIGIVLIDADSPMLAFAAVEIVNCYDCYDELLGADESLASSFGITVV